MDAECVAFLTKLGLTCLIEKFKEQFIDHATLLTLNKEDVHKLAPQLGLQKKLLSGLATLTDSQGTEHVDIDFAILNYTPADFADLTEEVLQETEEINLPPQNIVTNNSPNSKRLKHVRSVDATRDTDIGPAKKRREVKHSDVQNSVRRYLDHSIKGRKYLGLYNKSLFTSTVRSELAEYIIDCELNTDQDPNKVIFPKRFLDLRDELVAVFPSEVVSTYYVPRKPKTDVEGARQPRGKLYDKYTTLIKDLRAAGLRHKGQVNSQAAEEADIGNPDPQGTLNGDLSWLKRCIEPMIEATERWSRTSAVRIHSLRVTLTRKKGSRRRIDLVTDYLDQYAVLRQPWGYSLLEIDYKYLYSTSELALIKNWPEIAVRIKSMSNVEPIFHDTTKDTVVTLNLIPKLFGPINVGKWKTSAVDTQNGFLLHVTVMSALVAEVKRLTDKLDAVKKTLQPFPIIVGSDFGNITDCYVYMDNFFYRVDSPLRAIDVCFKAYHALHAFYSHQSVHPWLFLQKAVYGVVTQWDPEIPCVETRVKEYQDLEL